jgi:hypothetical protein
MDALDVIRGAIPYVDPLQRAKLAMESAERGERADREKQLEQQRSELEAKAQTQYAIERMQLATTGHTDRELEEIRRERDDAKKARIAELRDELAKLEGQGSPGGSVARMVAGLGGSGVPSPRSSAMPAEELTAEDIAAVTRSRQYAKSVQHQVMAAEARLFDQRRG